MLLSRSVAVSSFMVFVRPSAIVIMGRKETTAAMANKTLIFSRVLLFVDDEEDDEEDVVKDLHCGT